MNTHEASIFHSNHFIVCKTCLLNHQPNEYYLEILFLEREYNYIIVSILGMHGGLKISL